MRDPGKLDVAAAYGRVVRALERKHSHERAMELAVGGDFAAFGAIELALVVQYGLPPDGYLVDVGCGSGRLAVPLGSYLERGRYLGIDVVPQLLEHAQRLVDRPGWRFELATGLEIPERDGAADMVCFFSVLTHLLHEQSYAYLREARRVLRPGGRVVFSFLEFAIASHWTVFEQTSPDLGGDKHLNVFFGRDAIHAWSSHLGLELVAILDGDTPQVTLPGPVTRDDGSVLDGPVTLGQSLCVLEKPA